MRIMQIRKNILCGIVCVIALLLCGLLFCNKLRDDKMLTNEFENKISTSIELRSKSFGNLEAVTIMLHGYGDSAENFRQIGEYFSDLVPNRIILIPNAIIDLSYGYAWFHINDLSNINGPAMSDGVKKLDKIVADYIEEVCKTYNCQNIEVVGFSQGAMLAMRTIYLSKYVKRVLASSGIFYVSEDANILSADAKVLITHGKNDNVVPCKYCTEAYDNFKKLGMNVELVTGDYGHTCDGLLDGITWFFGQR